jgi:hypothetical protein
VTAAYSGRSSGGAAPQGAGGGAPGRASVGAPPAAAAAAAAAPMLETPPPAGLLEGVAAGLSAVRLVVPALPAIGRRNDLDGDHPAPCLSSGPAADADAAPATAPLERAACPLAAAAARVEAWEEAGERPGDAAWAVLERCGRRGLAGQGVCVRGQGLRWGRQIQLAATAQLRLPTSV